MSGMSDNIFATIVQKDWFQRFIIGVIIASAILVGLETYPQLYQQYRPSFRAIDYVIQAIFTIEIIMRILAYGQRPLRFFKSATNVIDFLITAIFYIPFGGSYAAVFRLVRIIRIFRLITALPRLQILVGALFKSIPSMSYIALLLLLLMYIFGVLGSFLFGANDPAHFGDLGTAILTLFQIITLEGWVEIMNAQESAWAPLYFISFILIGTMVVLNLFIGVITTGFDEVKQEIESELHKTSKKPSLQKELITISGQLDILRKQLDEAVKQNGKK